MTFYLEAHAHVRKKWEFEAGIEKDRFVDAVIHANNHELYPVFSVALTYHRIPDYEMNYGFILQGVELKTSEGDMIALGIEKDIPSMKSPQETLERILEQDGVPIVPHPFTKCYGMFRNARYSDAEKFMEKYGNFCYFEKLNSWADIIDPDGSIRAREFVSRYNSTHNESLMETGGSDAKIGKEDFASSLTAVSCDRAVDDKCEVMDLLREGAATYALKNREIDGRKILLRHPEEIVRHALLTVKTIGPYETFLNTVDYMKTARRK